MRLRSRKSSLSTDSLLRERRDLRLREDLWWEREDEEEEELDEREEELLLELESECRRRLNIEIR